MPNRQAQHDIAPIVRHGFKKGLRIAARRSGKTIPELFADMIEQDFLGTMNAVSKYTVRESKINQEVTVKKDSGQLDTWLHGFSSGMLAVEKALEHKEPEMVPALVAESHGEAGKQTIEADPIPTYRVEEEPRSTALTPDDRET